MTVDSSGNPSTLQLNFTSGAAPINQTFDISNNGVQVPYGNGYSTSVTPTAGGPTYTLDYAGASEPTVNPDGSAHTPSLTYTTYGMWTQSNPDNSGATGVFAAGQQTPVGTAYPAMTATYNGGAMGSALQNGNAMQLFGTSSLTANFGSGAITGNLALNSNAVNGPAFDNVSMNGNIITNTTTFSGTTAGTTNAGATGNFAGQFNGPAYDEVGGTWSLQGTNLNALGSFGGTRH